MMTPPDLYSDLYRACQELKRDKMALAHHGRRRMLARQSGNEDLAEGAAMMLGVLEARMAKRWSTTIDPLLDQINEILKETDHEPQPARTDLRPAVDEIRRQRGR